MYRTEVETPGQFIADDVIMAWCMIIRNKLARRGSAIYYHQAVSRSLTPEHYSSGLDHQGATGKPQPLIIHASSSK